MPFSAAQPPTAFLSSYLRGMGVLGSAAGRSLSFLMLPSTAFSPCAVHYSHLIILFMRNFLEDITLLALYGMYTKQISYRDSPLIHSSVHVCISPPCLEIWGKHNLAAGMKKGKFTYILICILHCLSFSLYRGEGR